MARKKSLTKKQKLQQQYRQQIRRIEKGYRRIEYAGGSFSKSISQIIKPVKNPTEATVRRLKSITMDELYRQAKTETGESGWKLRLRKYENARSKSYLTRTGKKLAFEYNANVEKYWHTYSKKEKKQAIEDAWSRYLGEQRSKREWQDKADLTPEEPLPETSYEEPDYGYVPDFSTETESSEVYDAKVEENIETILNDNQDTTFAKAIKNEFDKMKENMSESEFQEWLKKNGQKFLNTVEEVVKYEPKASHTGEGLNKFTQSMTMLNDGITPLDKYSAGNDAYYPPPDQYMEDYYEDYEEEQEEDESDLYVERTTGEIERLHKETYLQRVDKWGREHYNTEWFDENGLTVNISNYIPISQVKENEDYY